MLGFEMLRDTFPVSVHLRSQMAPASALNKAFLWSRIPTGDSGNLAALSADHTLPLPPFSVGTILHRSLKKW